MAFHQPLVPVLPVARELFSKTKLFPSRNALQNDSRPSSKKFVLRGKKNVADATIRDHAPRRSSSSGSTPRTLPPGNSLTGTTFVDEPEATGPNPPEQEDPVRKRQQVRPRLLSMFVHGKNVASGESLPSVSSSFLCLACLGLKFLDRENIARREISYRIYEARLCTTN